MDMFIIITIIHVIINKILGRVIIVFPCIILYLLYTKIVYHFLIPCFSVFVLF